MILIDYGDPILSISGQLKEHGFDIVSKEDKDIIDNSHFYLHFLYIQGIISEAEKMRGLKRLSQRVRKCIKHVGVKNEKFSND